jgi:ubiquitin carboxyl-terminal hydrolase 22/27/51
MFAYDLFAVVTHEGKLDNGHYWADVRCGDEWWHCDDDKGKWNSCRQGSR